MLLQIIDFIQLPQNKADWLQAQRVFHGRGHAYQGLDHITIDWLPPVLFITLFAVEPIEAIEELSDKLLQLFHLVNCQKVLISI